MASLAGTPEIPKAITLGQQPGAGRIWSEELRDRLEVEGDASVYYDGLLAAPIAEQRIADRFGQEFHLSLRFFSRRERRKPDEQAGMSWATRLTK